MGMIWKSKQGKEKNVFRGKDGNEGKVEGRRGETGDGKGRKKK